MLLGHFLTKTNSPIKFFPKLHFGRRVVNSTFVIRKIFFIVKQVFFFPRTDFVHSRELSFFTKEQMISTLTTS